MNLKVCNNRAGAHRVRTERTSKINKEIRMVVSQAKQNPVDHCAIIQSAVDKAKQTSGHDRLSKMKCLAMVGVK